MWLWWRQAVSLSRLAPPISGDGYENIQIHCVYHSDISSLHQPQIHTTNILKEELKNIRHGR
jgi:hypothetical protein